MDYKYKLHIGTYANETLWKYAYSDECIIENIFRGSNSYLLSALRMYSGGNFTSIWLKKKKNDDGIPIIITLDAGQTIDSLKRHIASKCEGQSYIFYYWNPVEKCKIKPDSIKQMGYEVWSFDYKDCQKYGLKYNPTFYFESWYNQERFKEPPIYDAFYIGRDKGKRADKVEDIQLHLKSLGIDVVSYHTAPKWYKRFSDHRYQKYVDFQEMIALELKGKAVLDVVMDQQSGPTLRVFDALCNGRKLITNNPSVKDMRLYNPNNVFVLGTDNEEELVQFINSDYDSESDVSYYRFENWLKRFEDI